MQVLQVQLDVGADPAEVGRARRWARSRLVGHGMDEDEPAAETAIVLISELITNAVVHTCRPAVLRLLFGSGPGSGAGPGSGSGAGSGADAAGTAVGAAVRTVRIEVADASASPPRPRHADGDDTNGRGLELVEVLADRWGWQPEGRGKRVWCEVDRTAPGTVTAYEPCASAGANVSANTTAGTGTSATHRAAPRARGGARAGVCGAIYGATHRY
ncbi:ATP-binding protein [Streptomyces sp. 150FB]|uniref:ATP-binding protein n=1 Tax=Streptomyces sp. 150FB TaxID=1576605 RepID=UPI000AF20C42|nr:ATP-binding protein [Streptomyces sp. 150FB]